MKRIDPMPDEPNPEDRRIYRRQTGGLLVSYVVAIVFACTLTYLNRPPTDPSTPQATQVARLKPAS